MYCKTEASQCYILLLSHGEYRVSVRGYALPMVPTISKEKLIIDWANHLLYHIRPVKWTMNGTKYQPTISYKYSLKKVINIFLK